MKRVVNPEADKPIKWIRLLGGLVALFASGSVAGFWYEHGYDPTIPGVIAAIATGVVLSAVPPPRGPRTSR